MSNESFMEMYNRLYEYFGPQGWWPGESPFEVMVGAVLTQNTNWNNVEKAIDNLNRADVLSFKRLSELLVDLLAEYIRPAGYFNVKAGRLQNLFKTIEERFSGSLDAMLEERTEELRQVLLSVKGIGHETADSILLYAAERPVFVVDAYTKRICRRIPINVAIFYEEIQNHFQKNLSKNYEDKELVKIYNELHAQIVIFAKEYCKKKPICNNCPLEKQCNYRKQLFQ